MKQYEKDKENFGLHDIGMKQHEIYKNNLGLHDIGIQLHQKEKENLIQIAWYKDTTILINPKLSYYWHYNCSDAYRSRS